MTMIDELENGKVFKVTEHIKVYKVRGSGIYEIISDANWADDGALKFMAKEASDIAKFFLGLSAEVSKDEQKDALATQKKPKA